MTRRVVVQVVAVAVVVVFAAGIWATGGQLEASWLRFYSVAVIAALGVLILWERFFWRLSWLQRLDSVPRDVRGTWAGTLTSFWSDPETGKTPPEKRAFLVVRQTAGSVSATLLTDESRSESTLGRVTGREGSSSLDYMYINWPHSRFEHRSPIHHGSTSLSISGRPARRLSGRYWTSRDSKGELDFFRRRLTTVEDFDSAVDLFSEDGKEL